jgi:DNA-binding XRE family transcriptional regulator
MPRIYRKTEYTADERAEIDKIRNAPKPLQTTSEKIHSASYNAILRLLTALCARREELGITQTELAERMGIESSALCRLETFKVVNPTVWTLMQWAEALHCTIGLDLKTQTRQLATADAK